MKNDELPKCLQPWRTLKIGQRVRLTGKYMTGAVGRVHERLDGSITGMARYAVRLDRIDNIVDCVRSELTTQK